MNTKSTLDAQVLAILSAARMLRKEIVQNGSKYDEQLLSELNEQLVALEDAAKTLRGLDATKKFFANLM